MSYWGHRFEAFLCADERGNLDLEVGSASPFLSFPSPMSTLHWQSPVNCNEQYISVVRGRLNGHRLLFGGEVDARDPADGAYIELKTNRFILHHLPIHHDIPILVRFLDNPRQEANFHRWKSVKWWLQSFLLGVPRILVGLRDDAGFVSGLKVPHLPLLPLPTVPLPPGVEGVGAGGGGVLVRQRLPPVHGRASGEAEGGSGSGPRRCFHPVLLSCAWSMGMGCQMWLMERKPGAPKVTLRKATEKERVEFAFFPQPLLQRYGRVQS